MNLFLPLIAYFSGFLDIDIFMKRIFILIIALLFSVQYLCGQEKTNANRKKIGLVLSGGGAKGFAHVGILRAIEEAKLPIDYIGGTSMGALVGGLYAMGVSLDEIEHIISITDWNDILGDKISRSEMRFDDKRLHDENFAFVKFKGTDFYPPESYSKGQKIRNILHYFALQYPQEVNFKTLPTPFYCVATNIEDGNTEILESGDLAESLRASMSIPSIFKPVTLNDKLLVDGGLVNNFPVDIMTTKDVDYIIGVDVQTYLTTKENINSVFDIIDQALSFTNNAKAKENQKLVDLHIKPDISKYHMLSFESVDSILKLGYDIGEAYSPTFHRLKKTLNISDDQYNRNTEAFYQIPDSVELSSVEFIGIEKLSQKLLEKNFNLKVQNKYTYQQIYQTIKTITAEKPISKIKYNLEDNLDGTQKLIIEIEEDIPGKIGVGLHYNPYFGANILFSGQYDNLFLKNSKFDLKINIAQEFAYKAKYSQYLSDRLTVGLSTQSHHLRINHTVDRFNVEPIKGNSDILRDGRIEGFFKWENNYLHTLLGLQLQDYRIDENLDLGTDREDFLYYVPRFVLQYDDLDHIDFPKRGHRLFLQTRVNLNTSSTFSGINTINLLFKYKKAFPITDKLTLIPSVQTGFTFDINNIGEATVNDTLQGYFIGGYKEIFKPEYIDFIGLNQAAIPDIREFGVFRFDVQYELKKDLFLSLKLNQLQTNFTIIDDKSEKLSLFGYGVAVGLDTFIGPIEFSVLGNEVNVLNIYASVGLSIR